MSGIIGSKDNIRGSGLVAKLGTDGQVRTSAGAGKSAVYEDLAGGISWQSVVTASTMTAVAGEGYPINTTSNTCTITLPSSASAGDEIIFTDYARNWGTNKIIIDSNGLKYQSDADTFTVEYTTDGQSLHIVYADATNGWIPISDDDVTDVPSKESTNENGIFGGGSGNLSKTNLVSSVGVVSTDVTGVMTGRYKPGGCEYGDDTGIYAFGTTGTNINESNLISNAGVVATDTTGVGTDRHNLGAVNYGFDKGLFGYGYTSSYVSLTNLVSNAGVVATDTTGVGTARGAMACEYGDDKGIFGYGADGPLSMTNLVSNVGVVATDVSGVGTVREAHAACSYGGDKGIFGFGHSNITYISLTNLVSNVGVVGSDVTGVGTARLHVAACEYGGDKGIFGYGHTGSTTGVTNLVSNSGVVASDVSVVGSVSFGMGACSYN